MKKVQYDRSRGLEEQLAEVRNLVEEMPPLQVVEECVDQLEHSLPGAGLLWLAGGLPVEAPYCSPASIALGNEITLGTWLLQELREAADCSSTWAHYLFRGVRFGPLWITFLEGACRVQREADSLYATARGA